MEIENCLDSELWHACAGGMTQTPRVNSVVYYSPQGHIEHSKSSLEFDKFMNIPPLILCRVISVKHKADIDTDEVFCEIKMIPLKPEEFDYCEEEEEEEEALSLGYSASETRDKPACFAKALTQSDANNGGGFSVPRYCAETIFPRLDYSAKPPVQMVLVKDVHGKVWKFRHIYRGTPRRHLLTTGWSSFVNEKKLVAGDSVVFLRSDNGDLCVGIRRAKSGSEQFAGWNSHKISIFGGISVFLRAGDKRRGLDFDPGSDGAKEKLKVDSVMEAASLVAGGKPFEVCYYPRSGTPEFVIRASAVRASMRVQWCPGMRFKMAFETEDSSKISWFNGTVSSAQVADPIRWPGSPWRLLEVVWDEPDSLQNVKRVNPWLVELVSNTSTIDTAPFSPPRKKLRMIPHLDSPSEAQILSHPFPGNPLIPSFPAESIQGARHIQQTPSLPEVRFASLKFGLFYSGIRVLNPFTSPPVILPPKSDWLALGFSSQVPRSECSKELDSSKPYVMLFGKKVFAEPQLSLSLCSSSDVNSDKMANVSDGSDSSINNQKRKRPSWRGYQNEDDVGSESAHCKLFLEYEEVGRTLDLSLFDSYEELYGRLAEMCGIETAELTGRVVYQDGGGTLKHAEDEPYGVFMKEARKLTISVESSCCKEFSCQMGS